MFGKNKNKDKIAERVDAPGYYRQENYYERRRPDMNNGPDYVNMSARHSGEYYTKERYPDGGGDYQRGDRYIRNNAEPYDDRYTYNGTSQYNDRYIRNDDVRYDDPRRRRSSRSGDYRDYRGRDYREYRDREYRDYYDPREERKRTQGRVMQQPMYYARKKKKNGWKIALAVILALIVVFMGAAYAFLSRMEHRSLKDILTNAGITSASGYTNFVLFGVDSRTGQLTNECHSDTIMICSLNKKTKEVRLASVYRDTYLDNTNGEYRKATECYYYGGPERAINMLNKNLDLNIRDYISVNFNIVVEVIDLLGGIDLEITEEEMGYINGYCVENEQVTGVGFTPLDTWGYVHLDGIQSLAYCRIRYTEGWDYKRTERQRTVLSLAFEKASKARPDKILSIANKVLPQISTSMNTVDMLALVATAGSYEIGEQTGFPFDKTPAVINGSDVVVPVNLAANVTQLHEFLFNEDFYSPSETVQQISNEIANASGVY